MSTLFWDDLDLMQEEDGEVTLVALSTDEGTSWGNAEAIDVELRSFIQYGTLVETENWNNRVLILALLVSGPTMDDTAAQERVIARKLHRPSLLKYQPDTATVETGFPVITSTLMPTDDDFREVAENEVIYQVKFTCVPFVRATELVVIEALEAGTEDVQTIETITGASTGWSADVETVADDVVTLGAYGIRASSATAVPSTETRKALFSKTFASFDTTTHVYIGVDWSVGAGLTAMPAALADASGPPSPDDYMVRIAEIPSPDDAALTRSYFRVDVGVTSLTALRFEASAVGSGGPPLPGGDPGSSPPFAATVKKLVRTDSLPFLSPRELTRSLELRGSMPTTGSIHVAGATALEEVVVYTWRAAGASGYSPSCRPYIQAVGSVHADAITGFRNSMTAGVEYRIPPNRLPEGSYTVEVRADLSDKAAADQIISYTVQAFMGATPITAAVTETLEVDDQYDDVADGFQFIVLTPTHLPPIRLANNPGAYIKITVTASTGAGTAYLDDLLLYNDTIGHRHHVNCQDSLHLWIDSPDLSNEGFPGLFVGATGDRSDAYSAFSVAEAIDVHEFDPVDGCGVFTIATGPTDPVQTAFVYFPCYWYRVAVEED